MISSISGVVRSAGATWVVVEVGGIGLKAWCPPGTAASVRVGQATQLATSLVVREDSLTLYAFADDAERDAFELVQTASGVGPKLAQAIVSVLGPDELRAAIVSADLARLVRVPGIGRKGAERLVIELRDKALQLGSGGSAPNPGEASQPEWWDQVRAGLEGLGWSARDAEAACERIAEQAAADPSLGVAQLMRAALRSLAKG